MGRFRGPKRKYQRRFGLIESNKAEVSKKRKTDYGIRLEEKQKLKFIYGISEKQMQKYVKEALKSENSGEQLLRQLEMRLDNVVFKLGFAPTIEAARQVVNHGHVTIDGRKLDIPSYQMRTGQGVVLARKIHENPKLQQAWHKEEENKLPSWLWREADVGKVLHPPGIEDLRQDINTAYVIEFYSK